MDQQIASATEFPMRMQMSIEKARTVQANVPWMMLGYVMCAWFCAWQLFNSSREWFVYLWATVVTVSGLLNSLAGIQAKKYKIKPHRAAKRLRDITIASLYFGVLWAIGVLLLWPTELNLQLLLIFMTAGLCTGALLSISVHLPTFYAYFLPCFCSVIVRTLAERDVAHYMMALATLSYLIASVRFVGTLSKTVEDQVRVRLEMAELAEKWRHQKEAAEKANLSKTQFLAAASHDLRQPVHSLSLLVGALANQPLGSEGTRLVTHIQSTVTSLDMMFNALLDMSKLDAQVVPVHAQAVNVQDLLQNICATEKLVALEKGLQLRSNTRVAWVHTDPRLLERVLRNLLSNALRYTDKGGVLVGLRTRNGKVLIRLWDSGRGIPLHQQDAVFQEFVQLHNPERDRNKGLGLGLAIVRRLTELLTIDLQLRSRIGRGTVVTLSLPAISQPVTPDNHFNAPAAPALIRGEQLQGHVLVIDDDAQVRVGAQALLQSWGYTVNVASGREEFMAMFRTNSQVPDLVICDFRLREQENGIETVEYLRTQYNEEIPAILITGDTAPQHLHAATRSGLALLHKPVDPAALKVAIDAAMVAHQH